MPCWSFFALPCHHQQGSSLDFWPCQRVVNYNLLALGIFVHQTWNQILLCKVVWTLGISVCLQTTFLLSIIFSFPVHAISVFFLFQNKSDLIFQAYKFHFENSESFFGNIRPNLPSKITGYERHSWRYSTIIHDKYSTTILHDTARY
jgi:hypothetical protein